MLWALSVHRLGLGGFPWRHDAHLPVPTAKISDAQGRGAFVGQVVVDAWHKDEAERALKEPVLEVESVEDKSSKNARSTLKCSRHRVDWPEVVTYLADVLKSRVLQYFSIWTLLDAVCSKSHPGLRGERA